LWRFTSCAHAIILLLSFEQDEVAAARKELDEKTAELAKASEEHEAKHAATIKELEEAKAAGSGTEAEKEQASQRAAELETLASEKAAAHDAAVAEVADLKTKLEQAEEQARDASEQVSKLMDSSIALTTRKSELEAEVRLRMLALLRVHACVRSNVCAGVTVWTGGRSLLSVRCVPMHPLQAYVVYRNRITFFRLYCCNRPHVAPASPSRYLIARTNSSS
jgi:hypothetical protein